MVSCQKDPTRNAYAWQIGPFWQDTIDIVRSTIGCYGTCSHKILLQYCVVFMSKRPKVMMPLWHAWNAFHISRVSCQKGPICHA